MKPIRVAFVLPDLDGGGSQRVALNLLRGLPRESFAPELIVFERKGPLAALIPADSPVLDLRRPRLRAALPLLARRLRERRPDAIFSTFGHVNLALLALRPLLGFRPRLVIREGNTPSASLPSLRSGWALAAGYRTLYRFADRVVCQSDRIAEELERRFAVPPSRLVRLPNPVDSTAIRSRALRVLRHPGPGIRFVASGRLTPQKGFDRLLSMFAALPESCHLTLLGEGPSEAALRGQAERLGLARRVLFCGFVESPWPLYAGADAFLLPSRWEGMPNAALEALACGAPVIAAPEAGGFAEVAAEAPHGAATIAAPDADFIAAMLRVREEAAPCLRPSLLPARFEADSVLAGFSRLLSP